MTILRARVASIALRPEAFALRPKAVFGRRVVIPAKAGSGNPPYGPLLVSEWPDTCLSDYRRGMYPRRHSRGKGGKTYTHWSLAETIRAPDDAGQRCYSYLGERNQTAHWHRQEWLRKNKVRKDTSKPISK